MTFDWAIFLGAVAIAVAIFFGLREVRKDISGKLFDIREKVVTMGVTLDNAWDLLKMRFFTETGTVERNLSNLGKTRITAKPGTDRTVYVVDVEKPVLEQGLIVKLSKKTDLEGKELQLFDNQIPTLSTPVPTRVIVVVPCTEPTKCTEYMSIFLKWLNSTYYNALSEIKKYEEPIQI